MQIDMPRLLTVPSAAASWRCSVILYRNAISGSQNGMLAAKLKGCDEITGGILHSAS
jgi:hypothetical protein